MTGEAEAVIRRAWESSIAVVWDYENDGALRVPVVRKLRAVPQPEPEPGEPDKVDVVEFRLERRVVPAGVVRRIVGRFDGAAVVVFDGVLE